MLAFEYHVHIWQVSPQLSDIYVFYTDNFSLWWRASVVSETGSLCDDFIRANLIAKDNPPCVET